MPAQIRGTDGASILRRSAAMARHHGAMSVQARQHWSECTHLPRRQRYRRTTTALAPQQWRFIAARERYEPALGRLSLGLRRSAGVIPGLVREVIDASCHRRQRLGDSGR